MAICGTRHPDADLSCILPEGQCGANHTARSEGQVVSWPNESFIRPVRLETTDLRALVGRTARPSHARPIAPRPVPIVKD